MREMEEASNEWDYVGAKGQREKERKSVRMSE